MSKYFGVSDRTISKDISFLINMGIPIYYDNNNGFKILKSVTAYGSNINLEDALLILTSLNSIKNIPKKRIVDIQLKIIRQLPSEQAQIMLKFVNMDSAIKSNIKTVNTKLLPIIEEAILEKRQIKLIYQSPQYIERTEHVVDPYGITWYNGRCYVIAYSQNMQMVMNFRFDRIKDVELTGKEALPADFDVDEYIRSSWHMFSGPKTNVILRIKKNLYDIYSDELYNSEIIECDGDWLIIKVTAMGIEGIKMWILRLGENIKVIEPVELKEAVLKTLKKTLEIYNQP